MRRRKNALRASGERKVGNGMLEWQAGRGKLEVKKIVKKNLES